MTEDGSRRLVQPERTGADAKVPEQRSGVRLPRAYNQRRRFRLGQKFLFLWGLTLLPAFAMDAKAQESADYFRQNCMSCHTIGGGRVTGPDLKNVAQRRDRAWLVQFMQNPKAMLDSGDSYAVQLQQEARGVVMPTVPGMTPARADALLDLIEAESKLAKSQFAGVTISDRPFTALDAAEGRKLFLGVRPLANGGPACVSCHTMGTLGGLGGGRLGPDLTLVYERLGGRKGVGTWLSAPATPTMQPLFKRKPLQAEEILPLLAFTEDASKKGQVAGASAQLNFFLIGFGVMVLGLISLQFAWRKRFHAVRRPLVHGREASGSGQGRGER